MKAFIINIGDEILNGQIENTNAKWMSEKLREIGVEVVEQRIISDNVTQIKDALQDAHQTANIVLITGGLGPTKDDVTKKALSEFFESPLKFHKPSYNWIQKLFKRIDREIKTVHKEQCYLPETAMIYKNKYGTAPGMMFEKGKVNTYSLPGIPYEMKYLMNEHILPEISNKRDDTVVRSKTILTVGAGESEVSEYLSDIENSLPENVTIAYLPYLAQVRVRVTMRGTVSSQVDKKLKIWSDQIKDRLGSLVFGEDDENLPLVIQRYCISNKFKVATAESCTSGFVAKQLTSNSGSSAFFEGSIVAYSNHLKKKLLSVPESVLGNHGAVSEQTVKAMVKGALKKMEVDIVVATSGVAGPTGGTPSKPVGTIWLACGNKKHIETQVLELGKDRSINNEYSTIMALNLLRRFLMGV